MSVTTTPPPLSFYGPTPEGFPPPARLAVERYEAMIDSGLFTDADRFELVEGTLVKKMTKGRRHSAGSVKCRLAIERLLPVGWHVRTEMPVRIPARESMLEPDVAVNIRKGSPTYGKWEGVMLSADNGLQLFIPEGFAHGFLVTGGRAVFHYKCTAPYDPKSEGSIGWDDPTIAIEWPRRDVLLSPKDAAAPRLADVADNRLFRFER